MSSGILVRVDVANFSQAPPDHCPSGIGRPIYFSTDILSKQLRSPFICTAIATKRLLDCVDCAL